MAGLDRKGVVQVLTREIHKKVNGQLTSMNQLLGQASTELTNAQSYAANAANSATAASEAAAAAEAALTESQRILNEISGYLSRTIITIQE